jgi:flagellar biosynthesis/type III secretory pathway protein FliH
MDYREHLDQLDQRIAEAKGRITQQNDAIAELERDGDETGLALALLEELQKSLHAFEQRCERIFSRLNGAEQ